MRRYLAIALAIVLGASGMWLAMPRPVWAQGTFAPFQCTNSVAISAAASTQLVTANNANMFIYVCAIAVNNANASTTAQFSLVEGTGTTCATNITAVAGGTTAAAGYSLGASGSPLTNGGGVGFIFKTKVPGDNLCMIEAGAGPIAGAITISQANF